MTTVPGAINPSARALKDIVGRKQFHQKERSRVEVARQANDMRKQQRLYD